MQSENDKIKYWKYKLQQKQKTQTDNPSLTIKTTKHKSPHKRKTVPVPTRTQDNFFSQTLDKLKHLLQMEPSRKMDSVPYSKRSKDNIGSKSTMRTNTQPIKKSKTADLNPMAKSVSLASAAKKQKKSFEMDKSKQEKASPSKSKSKSKSKNYIRDRSKELVPKNGQIRASPNKKSSKNKTKIKEYLPQAQTVHLSSFSDTDPVDHKYNQSVIVHEVNTSDQEFLYGRSNLNNYEEQEQKQHLRQSSELGNRIICYLRAFIQHAKYVKDSRRGRQKNLFSLKTMIRSQEQKLLQLKNYLKQLKGSDNLNDSLQVIINKVNDNIVGLKEMEQASSVQTHSGRDLVVSREKVASFVQEVEEKEEYLSPLKLQMGQPILKVNGLSVQQTYNQQGMAQTTQHTAGCDSQQKDQSDKTRKKDAMRIENEIQLQQEDLIKELPHQKQSSLFVLQHVLKSNDKSSLLLSAQSKSQIRLLSPDTKITPVISISISNFLPPKEGTSGQQHKLKKEISVKESSVRQVDTNNKTLNDSLNKILEQQQLAQTDNSSVTTQMKDSLCDEVLTFLIAQLTDCFEDHRQLLQKLVQYHHYDPIHMEQIEQVRNDFNLIGWPIQSTDAYLIELAGKVLKVAEDLGFRQNISKPLGVSTLTTLKYMRHFEQSQQNLDLEQEFEEMDRYVEILSQEDFQQFETECSCNPDHAQQLILNRSLYDVLNVILDQLRPYGSKGRPAFCFGQKKYVPPSLSYIQTYVFRQLKKILDIKLGVLEQAGLNEQQMREAISKSLARYNKDLIEEIERQYAQQTDDGLQTYELMVMVEAQVWMQQAQVLHFLQFRKPNVYQY